MMNKTCRYTRREIDESDLHQALSDRALEHIQFCAACQTFRNERTRLRDLVGSLDQVTAPADFEFRLRARLATQRQPRRQGFFSGFGVTVPATIAAALLVILVGSIFWMKQTTPTQDPTVAKSVEPSRPEGKPATAVKTETETSPVAVALTPNPTLNRKPGGSSASKNRIRSSDFNELTAQSIRGSDSAGAVSLAAPVKPLVVSMEDDRGATRTISLPPVSFGSQRLVDNRIPQGANGSRVW
jgi:hypothetical protein